MSRASFVLVVFLLFGAGIAQSADYGVTALNEPPPKDGIAAEIMSQLPATGIRVTRDKAPYCDLWLCQALPTVAGFKATAEVLYPFSHGQLMGVARFARGGKDFRDQEIRAGLYTVRFAQQPIDGAHVGTSPTRDFLLLLSAANDRSREIVDEKLLAKQSAEAANTAHPAVFGLQQVKGDAAEQPSIRHQQQPDWWIVTLRATVQQNGAPTPLPIGVVVAGVAADQ